MAQSSDFPSADAAVATGDGPASAATLANARRALADGDAEAARTTLAEVLPDRPDQTALWCTLAEAYLASGRPAVARELLETGERLGWLDLAERSLRDLVDRASRLEYVAGSIGGPDQTGISDCMQHARAGDLKTALTRSGELVRRWPEHTRPWNLRGWLLRQAGRPQDALTCFRRGLRIDPEAVDIRVQLGDTLQLLGAVAEAAEAYGRALKLVPARAPLHFKRGNAFVSLNRPDAAEAHFRRAIALKPNFADAHNNLLELLQQSNDKAKLDRALAVAREACPDSPLIALSEAKLLRARGELERARALLEAAPGTQQPAQWRAARAAVLGGVLDALGKPDTAMEAFREANDQAAASPRGQACDPARYRALVERIAAALDAREPEAGHLPPADAPAFLVGFPRSGTTLLDSVLRSHAAVEVVEERPALSAAIRALENRGLHYPEDLARLDETVRAELHAQYRSQLDAARSSAAGDPAALVVDKLPLNLIHADLIAALYPGARIVLALRHPCDCVLSCVMQNFGPNDAMANFWRLEHAAALYDRVMRLWVRARAVLPLNVVEVRYEDVVADFDRTVKWLLTGLGQGWDPGVRRFAETARARKRIDTPSYEQVTQPLYRRASGRWQRYRGHLEPVLPTLRPWIDHFGYDA